MGTSPVTFHEVHGHNIVISKGGSQATRTESFNQALCFTNRPIAQNEKIVIRIAEASRNWSGSLRVGVTEHDPSSLARNLPKFMCPDLNREPGNYGKALEESHVRLKKEIVMYHRNGKVMIRDGDQVPEELITGVPTTKPLYFVFDVYGNTKSICIGPLGDGQPSIAPVTPTPKVESKAFPGITFRQAHFAPFKSEELTVTRSAAQSTNNSSSAALFAVTGSKLKPEETLVVKLEKLVKSCRINFVLTTEEPARVHACRDLGKLCDTTYSLAVESEMCKAGDELAINISTNGAVCISLNNRGWQERIHVDTDIAYHVAFDMANVSSMTAIGITTDLKPEIDRPPVKSEPFRDASLPPDCIVCLESPRSVLLEPCAHFALCELCAHALQKSERRECPVCRAQIKGVKKIYMI
ncbi:E3 ubiquitin-protein ligase NEURL1B [Galendromus occidentalis]|uniref:E3 ubiquitin-protein ligase NEURL1B n=1 Tax=Galendromus occidentalis TaxID=34638 RepID=A0AAJ6VZ09_9ACAR|nr:E3 ubiquitin-protein ligase NEURL1B [Galendromus occidentalis]